MSRQTTLFQTLFKDKAPASAPAVPKPDVSLHKQVDKLKLNDDKPSKKSKTKADKKQAKVPEKKQDKQTHPVLCKPGSCQEERRVCTVQQADGTKCGLLWCYSCVLKHTNGAMIALDAPTDLPMVKQKGPAFACPACRHLCECEYCHHTKKSKSSAKMMVPMVRPPVFERMTMLYEDDEIWLRLQIREFVFRFASVLGMDERWLASMQNVQGDWRMRHLATRVVFRVLCVLQSGHVEPKAVQLAAQRVLHSWAADAGLQTGSSKLGKEKLVMLGEMIDRKGMSHQRWQDVMDLVVANAKANKAKTKKTMTKEPSSSPIPTQRDSDDDENDNDDEENQEEEKLDPLLLKPVQRLTDLDKLRLLQMVLELALCSDALRTDMVQAAKMVRVLEDDLKQEKKQFDMDDLRDKAQRIRWLEQLDQFRLLGMNDKIHQTQIDLDKVDADIVHRSLSMARRQRDVLVAHCRADPRLVPLITPWDNNQYWLFMDLTMAAAQPPSPQTLALQEPHWFQGVVVIGHDPCDLENNKNDQNDAKMDTDRAWMAIHGLPQLQQLDKWLAAHYQTCSSEEQANYKAFKQPLARRMQYLKLLPEL